MDFRTFCWLVPVVIVAWYIGDAIQWFIEWIINDYRP